MWGTGIIFHHISGVGIEGFHSSREVYNIRLFTVTTQYLGGKFNHQSQFISWTCKGDLGLVTSTWTTSFGNSWGFPQEGMLIPQSAGNFRAHGVVKCGLNHIMTKDVAHFLLKNLTLLPETVQPLLLLWRIYSSREELPETVQPLLLLWKINSSREESSKWILWELRQIIVLLVSNTLVSLVILQWFY